MYTFFQVRNERNKAREESRQMRGKLEHAFKECAVLKREKHSILNELDSLKKQLEKYNIKSDKNNLNHVNVAKDSEGATPAAIEQNSNLDSSKVVKKKTAGESSSKLTTDPDSDFVDKLLAKQDNEKDKDTGSSSGHSDRSSKSGKSGRHRNKSEECPSPMECQLQQQVAMLQLKLQQAQKTLHRERE